MITIIRGNLWSAFGDSKRFATLAKRCNAQIPTDNSVVYKQTKTNIQNVSRFGLAVRCKAGKQRDLGSNPLRLSFLFKSVVCEHCLVTLSITVNGTFKWLSSLPILTQKSFWWWQCSNRYIISPPPPNPLFSPTLISRMVSVDVKHHVYIH